MIERKFCGNKMKILEHDLCTYKTISILKKHKNLTKLIKINVDENKAENWNEKPGN